MEKVKSIIKAHPVVFFSKTDCKYCVDLERDLSAMQVPYEKVMLETDISTSLVTLTNCKTVPQLFINGQFIGGYSEFSKLCASGKIFGLLKAVGIEPVVDF